MIDVLENYEKIKDLMNISQRDNYSKALQYTGNLDKAVREMETLIQNTGESEYEYRLAELYTSTEKLDKASDIIRNLYDQISGKSEILFASWKYLLYEERFFRSTVMF